LFVERVGAQADLQDRHAGRIVLHHDRGLDAAGMSARIEFVPDTIWRSQDRGSRQAEKNLLDRDAVQCLRLDVFDTIDA